MIFKGSLNTLNEPYFTGDWGSPKTGEVLIHKWFSTGGILNLGNLNSPLHWNCIKSWVSKSGISFVGLELILTKNESAKHFSSILRMSEIH